MAKETMIVFVYDTECLSDEADDPVKAVLYFHPSWVSDTQKVALCGQLMGTSYFLKYCFFKPRIISLQNGKFVFKEFGRLILAVGTDRNIADNILQQRADLLASLIRFYHCDLQIIFGQYSTQQQQQHNENSNLEEQHVQQQYNKNFSDKLYQIFETYLPILQCNGNVFHYVPKLRLPKSASNIYLDAIQILQHCQQTKGILAGAILYHNKIVASQLGDEITKQLVISDPLHIRGVGEYLHTNDFHIPNGVQMLVAYIKVKDYEKLSAESKRAQTLQTMQLQHSAGSGAGGSGLPFQFAKRKMKRDKSLIFSNIPEECGIESSNGSSKDTCSDEAAVDCCADINSLDAPPFSQMPTQRPKTLPIRPTHLPLRLKNTTRDILPESGIASINFDETDSYPEFIGRTSVCSTPMTENKVLQVDNIMSICANAEDEPNANNGMQTKLMQRGNSLKVDFEKFCQNFLLNNNNNNNTSNKPIERRSSLTDLQDSWKKFSKKLSLKPFATEYMMSDSKHKNGSADIIENGNDDVDKAYDGESEENSSLSEVHSLTITDPTCPLLDVNGQPISRSLFQEFLEKYYKLCAETDNKQRAELSELIKQFKEFESELQQLDGNLPKTNATELYKIMDNNSNIAAPLATTKTPLDKKSLSLPLKSIADSMPHLNEQLPAARRQQIGSIPLTPLMAKLSVLALNEERGILATPGGVIIDPQTPICSATKAFPRRSSLKCDEAVDALTAPNGNTSVSNTAHGLQRVELYMCGQQNMTLLLLMKEGASLQQTIVQSMFDICVGKFPHMESQLNQTLNINVEGDQTEGNYSFIALDNKWDAVQRTGPWNPFELSMLECLNGDLRNNNNKDNITNIILRSQDAVFYGQKSGRSEFYYKEPANQIVGMPPPSDAMGHVVMRAKTRLERDHSYILF